MNPANPVGNFNISKNRILPSTFNQEKPFSLYFIVVTAMLRTDVVALLLAVTVAAAVGQELEPASSQVRQGKFGFLGGATNLLSSLAQDLLSRSTTSSQVFKIHSAIPPPIQHSN